MNDLPKKVEDLLNEHLNEMNYSIKYIDGKTFLYLWYEAQKPKSLSYWFVLQAIFEELRLKYPESSHEYVHLYIFKDRTNNEIQLKEVCYELYDLIEKLKS